MNIQSIFFALIAYLGWGAGDIFGAIASRRIGSISTAFWGYLIGLIFSILYIPFAIADLKNITFDLLLLNLALGIILMVAFVSFVEGLRVGNPSLVGFLYLFSGSVITYFSW